MDEIDSMLKRIQELEDTVLYLSNTLAMYGVIGRTEAQVALKMCEQSRRVQSQVDRHG